MQKDVSLSTSSSSDDHIDQSIETISHGFNRQIDLKSADDSNSKLSPDHLDQLHAAADDDDDDDDDDFTFMFVGGDDSAIEEGEMFPLFDQKLILDGDYEVEEIDRLPFQPPVDKIFIQSPRRFPSSETGPYCDWSKQSATATAELNKKSNSTGFSKLWRLKEKGGRSNSYGRDAFVFSKHSVRKTTETGTSSSKPGAGAGDGTFVNVNVGGGKARVVKKAKKATFSAHDAYLKSKEEERHRSYLPYRPELMGFFTNVHGGLTKNVHPY